MATLTVTIAPDAGISVPANAGPFLLDAVFTRALPSATGATRDLPATIQDTVRVSLDEALRGALTGRPARRRSPGSGPTATTSSHRPTLPVSVGTGNSLNVALSAADVAIVAAADPQPDQPPPQAYRQAYFVQVTDTPMPFQVSKLQIAAVKVGDGGWTQLGLDKSRSPSSTPRRMGQRR
jgi:hypothetical protein